MTGNGMSLQDEVQTSDDLGTPSTQNSDEQQFESQWIKAPQGLGSVTSQFQSKDFNLPEVLKKLGTRELAILTDYLNSWTRNTVELLDKLKDTSPESAGMLAEIFYWRDISRVLEAIG